MCMEDVVIGRAKRTGAKVVTLANGVDTPLVSQEGSRTHLMIATSGAAATIASDGAVGTGTGNIPISGTLPPLNFDIETHGDIVTKAWTGAGVAGAVNVIVIETFLERQK